MTFPILADALVDPWLQAVIQLGCLGIVAFGAHHVLTKTIPGMQAVFLSELKEQRTLHNQTEVASQAAFLKALDAQRMDFKDMVKEYHATNNGLASRIHDLTNAIVNNQQIKNSGNNTNPKT
jgi:predicted nucleic acid-binding protein